MSFPVHPWKVVERGWQPNTQRFAESLMSLANGYMGLRGNFEEDYSGDSFQGTYLGGVWYPDKTRVGWWKKGYPEYYAKVINAINLIGIHVIIDQHPPRLRGHGQGQPDAGHMALCVDGYEGAAGDSLSGDPIV